MNTEEIKQALETAVRIITENVPSFDGVCQNYASVNKFYPQCANDQWTTGFWPGELWAAYDYSADPRLRECALKFVDSFKNRIDNKIETDHHDMGFLFTPSCVSAWKRTACAEAKETALKAADQLAGRFQEKGQFIQAWGKKGDPENYRYIIDCLLNTPLLYWAAAETGYSRYADIAHRHTQTCLANSIRPDGSTYHTFYMNPQTGMPDHGATHQGYSDTSFWARGQAWALYGMALAYKYDPDPAYLAAFEKVTTFFAAHLPDDRIPYWDMVFTSGTEEPRDSSSAAIAVCGLLEAAPFFDETKRAAYTNLAVQIMHSLIETCSVRSGHSSNGLLLHGTYCKHSPYNTCTSKGVDECVAWGDYFYIEALMRLYNSSWEPYW